MSQRAKEKRIRTIALALKNIPCVLKMFLDLSAVFVRSKHQYNKWSVSTEKDIQHHYPSGKCKSKPQ